MERERQRERDRERERDRQTETETERGMAEERREELLFSTLSGSQSKCVLLNLVTVTDSLIEEHLTQDSRFEGQPKQP